LQFGKIGYVFNREEGKSMNKQELVDAVASTSGTSKSAAEEAINAV
jgi:hypothetical protein